MTILVFGDRHFRFFYKKLLKKSSIYDTISYNGVEWIQ